MKPQAVIQDYAGLVFKKRELESDLRELREKLTQMEEPAQHAFLQLGMNAVRLSDGTRVSLESRVIPTPVKGKEVLCSAMESCEEAAFLIQPTYHELKFRAWVRERLEEGTLPQELEPHIRLHEEPRITVRSAKGAK